MDAVFCECSLSLFKDPKKALGEAYRVLKKKGLLIISDMYVRNPGLTFDPGSIDPKSCICGAKPASVQIQMLINTGFDLLLWEDHSQYLAQLTAKLIWADFPLEQFFPCFTGFPANSDTPYDKTVAKDRRLGYFLLVARKH